MFAYSHYKMGFHIEQHVKASIPYLFEKNVFQIANVKPDFVPSLLVKKHYIEESFPFVIDEIMQLLQTPVCALNHPASKRRFEARLGVVCHFISDFFCVPHNQRWEFHHSMIPHVKYEVQLDKLMVAQNSISVVKFPLITEPTREQIDTLLKELLIEYETKQDYKRDMLYSANVCSHIVSYIISHISGYSVTNKRHL